MTPADMDKLAADLISARNFSETATAARTAAQLAHQRATVEFEVATAAVREALDPEKPLPITRHLLHLSERRAAALAAAEAARMARESAEAEARRANCEALAAKAALEKAMMGQGAP